LPSIVVDAGPLIAMFTRSDPYHATARDFLARSEGAALITNLIVVGEVAAVLGRHARVLRDPAGGQMTRLLPQPPVLKPARLD
jgi:predicted nucleic acid-binding protein